jgi:hypothetical protein
MSKKSPNFTGKRPAQGPRVYGTALVGGVRHEASGVIDGTFSKEKGGWDSNTTCGIGSYGGAAVETDPDLYVTCIQCLGKRRPTGSILRGGGDSIRGMVMHTTMIDEVQHMSPTQTHVLIDRVGKIVVAGATRGYGQTPSGPLSSFRAAPPAKHRC